MFDSRRARQFTSSSLIHSVTVINLSAGLAAGKAAEPAQGEKLLDGKATEGDQDRVQPRRVVALRREVAVALAEHLELEPGDDVQAAAWLSLFMYASTSG